MTLNTGLIGVAGFVISYGLTSTFIPNSHPLTGPTPREPQLEQPVAVPAPPDYLAMNERELVASLSRLSSLELRRMIRSVSGDELIDARQQVVLRTGLEILAQRDPEKTLRWIDTGALPLGLAIPAIELAATLLARDDRENGLLIVKELESLRIRNTAMVAFATVIGETDPKTAMQTLATEGMIWNTTGIVAALGSRSSKEAAELLASDDMSNMMVVQLGMRAVMAQWAKEDPAAAWAWLGKDQQSTASRFGRIAILSELASDPTTASTALGFLAEMPRNALRQSMAKDLGATLAKLTELDTEIIRQALATGDSGERAALAAQLAGRLPPAEAAATIDSLGGQKNRNKAIASAMQRAPDREAALEIATSLGSPSDRIQARFDLLSHYYRKDPGDAAQVALSAEFPGEAEALLNKFARNLLPSVSGSNVDLDPSWLSQLPPLQQHTVHDRIVTAAQSRHIKLSDRFLNALSEAH